MITFDDPDRAWPQPSLAYREQRARWQATVDELKPKGSVRRRTKAATDRRLTVMAMMDEADRSHPLWAAAYDLMDRLTRDPDFVIPGEWLPDPHYPGVSLILIYSRIEQFIGPPPSPSARIVVAPNAQTVDRRGIINWDCD